MQRYSSVKLPLDRAIILQASVGCGTYENRLQKWPLLKIDITIDILIKNQLFLTYNLI
jgi:hypothetical protein